MKISWYVIVAAALAVVAIPPSSLVPPVLANGQERTSSNTLTDAEVQAAIDRGLAGAPAPRALYFSATSAVSAVAYSPEIRIGIFARHLKHSGGTFSVSSVPASVREPLLFIAMRSVIYKPPAGVRLSDAETVMFLDPQGMAPSNKHVPAVWVSREPESVLNSFGATRPYSDIEIIGAFPISAVREGCWVAAVRQDPVDSHSKHTWGALFTREDIDALRR